MRDVVNLPGNLFDSHHKDADQDLRCIIQGKTRIRGTAERLATDGWKANETLPKGSVGAPDLPSLPASTQDGTNDWLDPEAAALEREGTGPPRARSSQGNGPESSPLGGFPGTPSSPTDQCGARRRHPARHLRSPSQRRTPQTVRPVSSSGPKAKVEERRVLGFPTTMGAPALLFLLLGAALSSASSPGPPTAKVACWFVEETGGGGSGMPGPLSQRRAMLLLPPPGRRMDEGLEAEVPVEVEPGLAFQILDPSGTLWGGSNPSAAPLWLGADPDQVSCEVNSYSPQEAHVSWAAGLAGEESCPRSLEKGKWFITTIQNPETGYGVSSILHEEEPLSQKQDAAASSVTTTTAVLSVFTRTPQVQSRLGQDVILDCGFSAPAAPFSVEWRHQHRGAGRVILAYDGAAERISVSEKGVELFLDPESNNVSLCLRNIGVNHEGTYICTIYLPHLHAQQALELKAVEPPQVTLSPIPLIVPSHSHAELACEISGYYPLEVSVSWKRRIPGMPQEVLLDTWESGYRQSPDGTFSFTSFARLVTVQPEDHGASYSCHVAHIGLGAAGLRKIVKLQVAGSTGPSLEDAIGLFLVAFVLYGILQLIFRRVTGDATKTQKLE